MTADELQALERVIRRGLTAGSCRDAEIAIDDLVAEVRRLSVPKIHVWADLGQASPFSGEVGAIIAYRGAPPSVPVTDRQDVLAEREACAIAVQDLDAEAAAVIRARGGRQMSADDIEARVVEWHYATFPDSRLRDWLAEWDAIGVMAAWCFSFVKTPMEMACDVARDATRQHRRQVEDLELASAGGWPELDRIVEVEERARLDRRPRRLDELDEIDKRLMDIHLR